MADAAALVVALSAQLTKFEKDMKDAVSIADRQTKLIEDRFSRMNTEISNQLSGAVSGFAGKLGAIGSVLGALGPYGLAAAAGIGVAVLAMNQLVESAERYAESQKKLKESAETTGLSTAQFKALSIAAAQAGVDGDRFEAGINKFNAALDELQKKASGPLFDALRKYPEVLTALSNAKTPADAINILAKAIENLDGKFAESALLRQAFGRGGTDIGRVLKAVFDAGSVDDLVNSTIKLNKVDDELINRITELKKQIDAAKKAQQEWIDKQNAEETLKAQKQYLDGWSKLISLIEEATQKMQSGQSVAGAFFRTIRDRLFGGQTFPETVGPTEEQAGRVPASQQAAAAAQFPGGPPLPTAKPAQPAPEKTPQQILRDLNDQIAALGAAARQTELLEQKERSLKDQLDKGVITRETYNRAIAETVIQQQHNTEQLRESVGVATQDQIITDRITQFKDQANKVGLTQNEILQGTINLMKKAKETSENLKISFSETPELTRLGIEAEKTKKLFDSFAVSTFSNFESALGSVANGTTKLADAFHNMANSIIADLVKIALRMSVTGPLSSALSGLFGTAGTGPSAAFPEGLLSAGVTAPLSAGTFLPQRQGGGPVTSNSPYIVGEHGAELFVPHSSGQIVPGNIVRPSGSSNMNVTVNNYAASDTNVQQSRQQGPSGETLIIDVVKRNMARGAFDDTNRGRFGLRAQKVR